MRRYENRSTIMTSNRPLEDWGKLLSDVPTAGAILDRFLHHAITIAISGRSYRVKDSLPPLGIRSVPLASILGQVQLRVADDSVPLQVRALMSLAFPRP